MKRLPKTETARNHVLVSNITPTVSRSYCRLRLPPLLPDEGLEFVGDTFFRPGAGPRSGDKRMKVEGESVL